MHDALSAELRLTRGDGSVVLHVRFDADSHCRLDFDAPLPVPGGQLTGFVYAGLPVASLRGGRAVTRVAPV